MFDKIANKLCYYSKKTYTISKLVINSNYFIFFPLIYSTFFVNNNFIKISFAIGYSYYLYKHRYFYLDNIINDLLTIKIKLQNKYFKKSDFILQKVLLYTNLKDNSDVTKYFKEKITDKINRNTIKELYKVKNIPLEYNSDIRLKIFFSYKNINYIIYFPYSKNINKEIEEYYIPYPPYSDIIMSNYRNDIIIPSHTDNVKKKFLYSLFSIQSKNIDNVTINNIENINLINYFEMLKTPFNDFGILYNIPVKLIWVYYENNINLENIISFELTFLNPYFDEDFYELKIHNLKLTEFNYDTLIMTDLMKDILNKKKIYINEIIKNK
jgi:hypothetical protein